MLNINEIVRDVEINKNQIKDLEKDLKLEDLKKELEEIEIAKNSEEFWQDKEALKENLTKNSELTKKIEKFNNAKKSQENDEYLLELLELEETEEIEKELIKSLKNTNKLIQELETDLLLSEEYDKLNAIVTIHSGAGGTEAMDWTEMLYRMYLRWAEKQNYKIEQIDYLEGEEAGIKSVTFLVSGEYAYGRLKSENGVHRLVRNSPFDSGGRRHTSFSSVEVLPEIQSDNTVNIREEDIKMDTFRASGAGGQHVNKTSSAVRLTHIPTGLVVSCQSERSQFQNRDFAMKMLVSKLLHLKNLAHKEKIEDLKGVQMDISWGSQIRSYVFCPYTLVKDHRTNYEIGDVEKVMNGNIDEFIYEYLKFIKN